ncbi:MAG: hypothetical protein QF752_14565, partial [Planctomycetota bacterium]|nr:hypothetical protein [Planctomycetota bacterium]
SLGEHLRSTLKDGALDWAIDLLPVVPELESRLLLEDARSTTWPSYGNLLQGFRTLSRLLSAMPGHMAIYLDDFENAKEEEWEIVMDLVSEESIQLLILVSVPDTFEIDRSDSARAAEVLGEAGRLERIELKRLARSAIQPGIAALLETSLAHIDDSLIEEIEFLANGNPRNVGLLIECGRVEGFVYREGEGWTTDLPERERYVEGLLPREIELEFISSLRKLPPTHRQVSQALSLSPVPVPRTVLETVCRLNRTQSSMVFKDLVRDRIAVSRQRGGESCLALISLKVRTRLEGDVPLDDRVGIVDRIATEMEGVFGGEVSCVSAMAEIFGQTSRTEKTLAYRLAAGQQAFDDRRYGRAVQHLEEAQRCFHELSPRRQKKALTRRGFCPEVLERPVSPHYLFLLLGESLRTVGFFKRSAAAYEEGIERVKRKSADSALLHRGLGLARLQLHDYAGASQSFQEGQVEGVDNDPEVLGHQAHIDLRKDRYQKALDALKEAGAALKKGTDPSVRALLHHTVAEAYYLMGHWKESGRALDREKAVLEGESMNFFRPRHRVLQARLLLRRGKLLDAQGAIERVLAPAEGSENDPAHAQVHEMVGWIYLLQGEPGRGIDYFERALEKSTSDRFQTARAEEGLASAYLLSKDFEEATTHCGRGQELFDRVDCRRGRAATLHLRGRIATAAEDHEEAEFYFGYALKEYEELGVAWRLAALHVSQYELALARGQGSRARKHLEVAIARARKQDDRPTLSRIFRLQGERLLAAGEGAKAERCFRNALVALR